MNGLFQQITASPGWPILPIAMLVAIWVGLCFALGLTDAGLARRKLGRGVYRFMAIPDPELDREIETALHSSGFLVSALAPALGVTALLMAAMGLGAWIRDAENAIQHRELILLGGLVAFAFLIPAFLNWSLGKLLTRSLDRTFSRRSSFTP